MSIPLTVTATSPSSVLATRPSVAPSDAPAREQTVARTTGVKTAASIDPRDLAERISNSLRMPLQGLEFRVEQNSGRVILSIRDKETLQIIRQIPSEEALEIARALDQLRGVLVDRSA